MSREIVRPETRRELTEFLRFADTINARRGAHWPAIVPSQMPLLTGRGPDAEGREVLPLEAREGGDLVARVVAVVDQRYLHRWSEPIGHLVLFEAEPDTGEATASLLDEACRWLAERGMTAARCGLGPGHDLGFAIDAYDRLPPLTVRQNPDYYHRLLKGARFATERGFVDYAAAVSGPLLHRWRCLAAGPGQQGFEVRQLGQLDPDRRLDEFTMVWNEAFRHHWGMTPSSADEVEAAARLAGPLGMLQLSKVAYRDGEPVGAVWANPDFASLAVVPYGRQLQGGDRLSFVGVGVTEAARGHGLAAGMVASTYLQLHELGASHVSYTMVLDDNRPSRRTAEKLGVVPRANYVVYRRELSNERRREGQIHVDQ